MLSPSVCRAEVKHALCDLSSWNAPAIEARLRAVCKENDWQFRDFAALLRVVLTGSDTSPPLFEVMEMLAHDETMLRLER